MSQPASKDGFDIQEELAAMLAELRMTCADSDGAIGTEWLASD